MDDLLAILKFQIAGFVCDGSEPRAPRNPKCQSGGAVRAVKAAATCRLRAAGLQSPAGSPAAAILLTSLYSQPAQHTHHTYSVRQLGPPTTIHIHSNIYFRT